MRRAAAVDYGFLSNYEMNPLIPTFRRQAIDNLKLIGQGNENPKTPQLTQDAIVPTSAPPQPVTAPIEQHPWNEYDQVIGLATRNRIRSRWLRNTETSISEVVNGTNPGKITRPSRIQLREKNHLSRRQRVVQYLLGSDFVLDGTVEGNVTSGTVVRQRNNSSLNRMAPSKAISLRQCSAVRYCCAAQLVSALYHDSSYIKIRAARRDESGFTNGEMCG
jgi:hypothetical protein